MAEEPEYSLEQIEAIDREWTNNFAAKSGWDEHYLEDPVNDLAIFFEHTPGPRILDVGCGWGRYIWRFLDQGLDYHGLDQSSEMLRVAKTSNPDSRFIESSFRKIPFPNEHFDGLWSCCALSGIPKKYLVEILREHLRVLRRGGFTIFIMPINDVHEKMYTDDDGKPELYQAYYSLREFGDYVTSAGFSIVSAGHRWNQGSFSVLATRPL